ncbi:hypothetical protein Rahaq_4987 (plasmid) [Rahnella aceris]|uniref:Uncharacterized protein n=1 Tax=Rahnella sp. (strain Y9602) TaxID=2703885 RepID=A0A0H3FH29_RAHSY|nr:hypothetical protein Rahaq_4987 [Rahnella aceris]
MIDRMPMITNEISLTGKFRFRRQSLTGVAILQVQVIQRHWRRPSTNCPAVDREVKTWRDATMDEAYLIQIKSNAEEACEK